MRAGQRNQTYMQDLVLKLTPIDLVGITMGGEGSTAEDTFYAKIWPHSLSLLLNSVETPSGPAAKIVRPVRVRNASRGMHVNISSRLSRSKGQ